MPFAQNPLRRFTRKFPVDGKVANLLTPTISRCIALSTLASIVAELSPFSATICRRIWRQSPKTATVAELGNDTT